VWNRVGISLSVYLLNLLKNGESENGDVVILFRTCRCADSDRARPVAMDQ
jgi:hypothetical protein